MRLLVSFVLMIVFSISTEIAIAQKIIWSDISTGINGSIRQANLDGTNPTTLISSLNHPRGLQIDQPNGVFYFSTAFSTPDPDGSLLQGEGDIQRANLDGTGLTTIKSDLPPALSLELDAGNGHLYWAARTDGKIQRMNLDGTGLTDLVTGLSPFTAAVSLDLVNGHMYFDDNQILVKRANLDGSNIIDIITTPIPQPRDFQVDNQNGHLYILTSISVMRSNLDGSGLTTLLTTGSNNLQEIRLDIPNNLLYFSDAQNGLIRRSKLDGSELVNIITGGGTPGGFGFTTTPVDTDGDGIPDNEDACNDSDLRQNVFIGGINSGVKNRMLTSPKGCTLADLINELVVNALVDASNGGEFQSSFVFGIKSLKSDGTISGSEAGALKSTAAKAPLS